MTPPTDGHEEFRRRAGDHDQDQTDEEILALIRKARDDDQKAHLLVLYQVNRNQNKMAGLLASVVDRLDVQEVETKRHRELVTRGEGAWRGMATTVAAVGLLGGYIVVNVFSDLREVVRSNAEQELKIQRLETSTPISNEAKTRLAIVEAQIIQNTGTLVDLNHRMDDHERADNRWFGGRKK